MIFQHPYKKKFVTALLTGCFFIVACENTEQQIKELTSRRIGVEEGKEISINYSVGGKTKATLTAPFMLRYQDTVPYTEFPKKIHADFYDINLTIESKLDALYGRYMETESKIFLRDSVRLFNNKGDTLYCNELYWDRNRIGREFYTDKPVRIRTRTHIIDGTGMEAPQDFSGWNIYHPRGTLKVPASDFPQ
ncbi:MAG TPA: LPS export ABC transporter periplasmic protein LptC [Chitinophagaceae bacterium]|nr:LPS export ABC transporter periplasmic protein LptC [Chitinophagaceae bacterium]